MRHIPLRIVDNRVLTRSVRDTAAFYREMERVAANPKLPRIGDVTAPGRQRLRIRGVHAVHCARGQPGGERDLLRR